MESTKVSNEAKQFSEPPAGKAGLYIYRDSFVGKALKKDVWLDGECVGETAPDTFFYKIVDGNTTHTVSTESEFSPNDVSLKTDTGKNYFIRQYIKLGLFVGGAGVEVIDEDKGKEAVSKLGLAKSGKCSN
ncbi:DUF2846 domain-containing protein [Shewanella sp. 4t3-1-2LB]|nr:DUF2846 domain-containing protein [Shewanella sp. 4t3-1-2LB]MBO1270266.1 DUF2846 domain-containing protein [Shewanella sp. 4t3-1-2LB]